MKQRAITALILTLSVALIFVLRQFVSLFIFDACLCVVIIISANEVARVFNRSGRINNGLIITIYPVLSFIAFFICYNYNIKIEYTLLIMLGLIVLLTIVDIILTFCFKKSLKENYESEKSTKTFASYCKNKVILTSFLMFYPSFILSSLYFFNHINDFSYLGVTKFGNIDFSLFLLLLPLVLTIATDTFAYLVGSTLKGPKLCPLISPKKTISGAIGGILGGVICGFGVYGIFVSCGLIEAQVPAYIIAIYTILASVISEIGDIFASILKREARTKDYSSIFPGHGGFMDRLDGISFCVFFTLLFFMLFIF